jgi:hypothetical protein
VETLIQLTKSVGGLYMELLFTNIPIYIALEMVREHLNVAGPSHGLSVLTEPSVNSAFFVHTVKLYLQIESAAMGPLLSSLLSNIVLTASEEVIGFTRDARINIFSTHSRNNLATRTNCP